MANANETLRDEALQRVADFLDSLVGVAFDEAGEAWDWEGKSKLRAAVYACRKLAEERGKPEAMALYVTLLEMDRDFNECGPSPLHLGDGEMWVGLNPVSEVKRLAKELRDGPPRKRAMTEGQQMVWAALDGRALFGKELALRKELDTSEETIRQHVHEMTKHGWTVLNRRSRGYFRPDAPPEEMNSTPPM